MISIENVSRRGFLKGMAGAGAFVLSARLLPEELLAASGGAGLDLSPAMSKAPAVNAFRALLSPDDRNRSATWN